MSKSEPKIIFEPHPVSAERKAVLRAAGFTIIDAVFAPAGYVHPDQAKAVPAKRTKE